MVQNSPSIIKEFSSFLVSVGGTTARHRRRVAPSVRVSRRRRKGVAGRIPATEDLKFAKMSRMPLALLQGSSVNVPLTNSHAQMGNA